MKYINFTSAGLGVSRLAFGCAPVMGRVGERQGLRAMADAYSSGVTHFDVARSYGYGNAERVLGRFIRDKRDRVTVTTKFGIVPSSLRPWHRIARPLVRMAAGALPLTRLVRRATHGLLAERNFEVDYARRCLETSLRELGTDYVDIWLLHEPVLELIADAQGLQRFIEDSIAAGRLRAWGLAHPAGEGQFASGSWGKVLQFESPFNLEAPKQVPPLDGRLRFVTRPFSGSADHLQQHRPLAESLGLNVAQLGLAMACSTAGERGAVVAGMFDAAHIRHNVRAVEHYDSEHAVIDAALVAAGWPPKREAQAIAGGVAVAQG
jgi:D-threo-aldose 1-dehydrogenase